MSADDGLLTRRNVADGFLDPPSRIALRRRSVELREPTVSDRLRRLDELLGPRDGLVSFGPDSKERCVKGNGASGIEIVTIGGPSERCAQVRQLGGEPVIGPALMRTVPQGQHVGFPTAEVPGMRGPDCISGTSVRELFLGELADCLQHQEARPP